MDRSPSVAATPKCHCHRARPLDAGSQKYRLRPSPESAGTCLPGRRIDRRPQPHRRRPDRKTWRGNRERCREQEPENGSTRSEQRAVTTHTSSFGCMRTHACVTEGGSRCRRDTKARLPLPILYLPPPRVKGATLLCCPGPERTSRLPRATHAPFSAERSSVATFSSPRRQHARSDGSISGKRSN